MSGILPDPFSCNHSALPQKDFFSSLEFITLINCLYYEYVNGDFIFSPG